MPLSTDIYQGAGQQSLAGGLAGALNQFTEQRARLSDLARQREQQDITQGYQNRALQRAEEAIPAQQAALQQERLKKQASELQAGVIGQVRRGVVGDDLVNFVTTQADALGVPRDRALQGLTPLLSGKLDAENYANALEEELYPEVYAKQRAEARYGKPAKTTPSALATLIKEQEAGTGIKMTPQEVNALYKQGIQKQVTPQLVQIAGQEGAPVYSTPAQAVGKQAFQKTGKEPQLSAQAQKELFEADETIQASSNVIGLLEQAKALNEKAYSGYGAKQRAVARSNIPGSSEEADATINLDNIMTSQALESLKAIFGGMPTEGERKILMDIQASVDKTPKQRETIMNRAKTAVENRIKFSTEKANKLRAGEYFKPAQANVKQPATTPSGAKFLGFE